MTKKPNREPKLNQSKSLPEATQESPSINQGVIPSKEEIINQLVIEKAKLQAEYDNNIKKLEFEAKNNQTKQRYNF